MIRFILLIIVLSFGLTNLHAEQTNIIFFSFLAFTVALLIRSKIWTQKDQVYQSQKDIRPQAKLYIFGREAEKSGLYESSQDQKQRIDFWVKSKKAKVLAGVYIFLVSIGYFMSPATQSPSLFPWLLGTLVTSYILITSCAERDLHRSWLLSFVFYFLPFSLGAKLNFTYTLAWILFLFIYLCISPEDDLNINTRVLIKDVLKRTIKSFILLSVIFWLLCKIIGVEPFNRGPSFSRGTFDKRQSQRSSSGQLLQQFTNNGQNELKELEKNPSGNLAQEMAHLEKELNKSGLLNTSDSQETRARGNSTIDTHSSFREKDLEQKWQKRIDDLPKNKLVLFLFLVVSLLAIYIVWSWLRKPKSRLQKRLTAKEKKSLRALFDNLYNKSFSPGEEVLQFYYGLEKALELVELGRPPFMPPIYHQQNIDKIFPALGRELHPTIDTYYLVIHQNKAPDQKTLKNYRKTIRKILVLIGVY